VLTAAEPVIDPASTMLNLLVRPGDTLELLFRRNGLSMSDLAAIVSLPDATRALKVLKPGDRLEIAHRDGQVVSLQRELDEVKVLSIARADSGFAVRTIERQVDVRTTGAHGVIQSSLFEAGTAAGIADRLVMDMAGIFEWDIDFIQDVREGDQFSRRSSSIRARRIGPHVFATATAGSTTSRPKAGACAKRSYAHR